MVIATSECLNPAITISYTITLVQIPRLVFFLLSLTSITLVRKELNNLIHYEPDPEGTKIWNTFEHTLFRSMDWSIGLFMGNSLCEVIDPLDSTLDSENS
jgi:hypothetical protein